MDKRPADCWTAPQSWCAAAQLHLVADFIILHVFSHRLDKGNQLVSNILHLWVAVPKQMYLQSHKRTALCRIMGHNGLYLRLFTTALFYMAPNWFLDTCCRLAGNENSAAEAGRSQAPEEAAKAAPPPARVGLAEVLDDLADEASTADKPGPSCPAVSPAAQSRGAQSAAGDAPGSADGLPEATLCTPAQPEDMNPTGLRQHFSVVARNLI